MDFLKRLRKANVERDKTTKKFEECENWTLSDWGVALAGEAGEVCNAIKKVNRGDGTLQKVLDEIGDVITYADLLLEYLHADMGEVVTKKFNEVSDKVGSKIKL